MKRIRMKNRPGSALAVVAAVMLILLTMGTALLKLGFGSRIIAISQAAEIEARAAADAGLTKAVYIMNQRLAAKTLFNQDLPEETDIALEFSDAQYSYSVSGNAATGYTVQCTGIAGRASKTITSTLKFHSPFDFAVFTKDKLDVGPQAIIDWINAGADDYNFQIGTNSTDDDKIILGPNSNIKGGILVGPGGNPDDVIKDNGANIDGDISSMSTDNDLPPITIPTWLNSLPSGGNITDSGTISTSGKYSKIDLKNGKILKINAPVTLYITGSINLDNSAQLQVDNSTNPNASLIIYLAGSFEGKNGGSINNLTDDSTSCTIYGLDSCSSMKFNNNSELYGAIYAPHANVTFNNSAAAYGSVIANQFEQKNSSAFYYDAALRDTEATDPVVTLKVSRWSEGN